MSQEEAQNSPKSWTVEPALKFVLKIYLYWLLTCVCLGVITVIFVVIFALTVGLDEFGHTGSRDAAFCKNNLKQFGLAMHNYLAVNGTFPPAYTVDANGRKMHSWRALLLPYFEAGSIQRELDIKYDYTQPWDSPHNQQLANKMPTVFRCPKNRKDTPNTTSYVAIVGNQTLWPFDRGRPVQEIQDGLTNTIAIVEITGADIPWLEPRDLPFDELTFRLNDPAGNDPSSKHGRIVQVLMAVGSARELSDEMSPAELRALLTVDGDEEAEPK